MQLPTGDRMNREHTMKQTNTKITYKYRDAGNYKTWGEEVIEGKYLDYANSESRL